MNPAPILGLVNVRDRYTWVCHVDGVALFFEVDENGDVWKRTFRRSAR
jgi:hypothetical protein